MRTKDCYGIEFGVGDVVKCVRSDALNGLISNLQYRVKLINGPLILVHGLKHLFNSNRFTVMLPTIGLGQSPQQEPNLNTHADEIATTILQVINSSPRTPTKENISNIVANGMARFVRLTLEAREQK